MSFRILVIVLVVLGLLIASPHEQIRCLMADEPQVIDTFTQPEEVEEIRHYRDRAVKKIMRTLETISVNRRQDSTYVACIFALGSLKTDDKKAISFLVENIDFKLEELAYWTSVPDYWIYSAALSLAEIGPIVYPDMIQIIIDPESTEEQRKV